MMDFWNWVDAVGQWPRTAAYGVLAGRPRAELRHVRGRALDATSPVVPSRPVIGGPSIFERRLVESGRARLPGELTPAWIDRANDVDSGGARAAR